MTLTEEQRLVISHCQDLEQLEGWLLRAAEISTVEELLPQTLLPVQEEDELAIAEANVEGMYKTLEELLSHRVAGHTDPALEKNIQAQFEWLAQRKQERAEALERAHQRAQPTALDELKGAIEEARKLIKESEEANSAIHP